MLVIGENSGLHIVLEVKNGMGEEQLIIKALQVGVKVYPLSAYYYHSKGALVLGSYSVLAAYPNPKLKQEFSY